MKRKIVGVVLIMALLMTLSFTIGTDAASSDTLVIVIDPGHGGTDSGASYGGINEKDVNLTIATYMKEALDEYDGVEVYLTRETDVYIGLSERAEIAASYDADLFISIHANASTSSSANGAEVYYQNGNYISNLSTSVSYSQLKELAQNFLDGLSSLGLNSRGIFIRNALIDKYADGTTADYYTVLRECKNYGIPALLIEHAFLSNTSDRTTYLSTNSQLKSLALSNVEVLVETFNLSKDEASITITAPDVTEYIVGDSMDTTGLTVNATYSDGTSATLDSEDYTISGFDSSSTGNKVITVSYLNATAKFVVCILAEGSDVNSTVVGDVNGDGEVKASDYLMIKDSFLEGIVLSDVQFARADVKQDDEIKASDYLMIKDYFLGNLASLSGEVEEETDTDADVETDTESETTTDTSTESGTSTDTSAESGTSTDTSAESGTSTDTSTESETGADTSTDSGTNTDTDTSTDGDSTTDTEADTTLEATISE